MLPDCSALKDINEMGKNKYRTSDGYLAIMTDWLHKQFVEALR